MCVPRDTSVYVGLLLFIWSRWETANLFKKRQTLATCENIIFRPLSFLSSRPIALVSFLFLTCSEVCPPRVCTLCAF